ncbi:hypothetical protein ACYOEI_24990 [Singulisphaera rosea]
MLPDFSAQFQRGGVSRLHFRARGGSNFVHDVHFLSGYLHDGRFSAAAVTRRGKKLSIAVERDCWELGLIHRPESSQLYIAKSRLTVGPVSSVRWDIDDPSCFDDELWIESIYLGAPYWETPEAGELVISAPHGGWKLSISLAEDFGDIRLDDLEMPYLFSGKAPDPRPQ